MSNKVEALTKRKKKYPSSTPKEDNATPVEMFVLEEVNKLELTYFQNWLKVKTNQQNCNNCHISQEHQEERNLKLMQEPISAEQSLQKSFAVLVEGPSTSEAWIHAEKKS